MKKITDSFFLRLLRWFCPAHLYEEIEGDLIQKFNRDLQASEHAQRSDDYRLKRAKRRLVWSTIQFFRPSIFLRNKFSVEIGNLPLLQNYFKISVRNLMKRKLYSFINVFGLSIGLAVCLVIWKYVEFELSYDNFHKNADNIYRTLFTDYVNGEKQSSSPRFGFNLGPALGSDVPEIKTFVRTHGMGGDEAVVRYRTTADDAQPFQEANIQFVDSTFLDVFTYDAIYGNVGTALDNPASVVITESIAHRYFGKDTNPLGKFLHFSTQYWVNGEYEVTAVIKDVPQNSHFNFDFLIPMHNLLQTKDYQEPRAGWDWVNFITYVVLHPNVDVHAVEAKMPPLLVKYTGPNTPGTDFKLTFQPVRELHLSEELEESKFSSIYFFILISIFILVIAWINYINLATARATERAREVGIKKALGVYRSQLTSQFILEALLTNLMALLFAIAFAAAFLPLLGEISGKNFSYDFTEPRLWILLTILFVAGSFTSGAYPAFVLSSFKTADVIKGNTIKVSQGLSLRKILVVFQFAASLILFAATVAIYKQIHFMQEHDKGLTMDQMLIVNGPRVGDEKIGEERLIYFKNELLKLTSIQNVASSGAVPGANFNLVTGMVRQGTSDEKKNSRETIYIVRVDPDFIETYDIDLQAGRAWNAEHPPDMKSVLINEEAIVPFGLGDPEQALREKLIIDDEDTVAILGVFKNVHWSSLKSAHLPMLLWPNKILSKQFSIHLNGNIHESVAKVEQVYKKAFPGNPFHYFFLDDFFNHQYKSDRQFGKVFSVFAFLTIIIACLGLFGLASFTTVQRMKEISIRKVLGASVRSIMSLLAGQFLRLVLIACTIAFPISWYGVSTWLDSFAFRIDFTWDLYFIPVVILIVIALCTVSLQTIQAAIVNPVKNLRSE